MRLLLKNGQVYQNNSFINADVLIENQKIKAIGKLNLKADQEIDVTEKSLFRDWLTFTFITVIRD